MVLLFVVLSSQTAAPPPNPVQTPVQHESETRVVVGFSPRGLMSELRVPIPADNGLSGAPR
mgnify:CR=1 FL=1